MSQQENVKIVQDAYAAFGRGDIQALLDILDEPVEWVLPGEGKIPQSGSYRGRAEVARFFQILDQSVEFSGFEPREFVAQDDRVIVLGWSKGNAKTTGRSFEASWAMAFTVRNGKIVKFREYTDTAAIAEAYAASASASA